MLLLLALLANMKVSYEGDDEILWLHDSSGQFNVKSYCRKMYKGLSTVDFLAKVIWKPKAPTKACFIAWAATKGKVPTEDMLKRRNFI